MSEAPPSGDARAIVAWLRVKQNTEIHAWLSVIGILVGIFGSAAVLWVSNVAHISRREPGPTIGVVDVLGCLFLLMWASTFIGLGIHDGAHYQAKGLRARFRRTRYSDAVVMTAFPVVSVLWAELALRPVLTDRVARAVDMTELYWFLEIAPLEVLEARMGTVMIIYYAVVLVVCVCYFAGLRFNPVDLDSYEETISRILPFGRRRMRS